MRWFTCTPVDFGGGEDFFARDSGLLSRGFRQIGVESMAVMPGKSRPDDCADLIRTDFNNLESADWWRGHQLDGVVLYAWGLGKYTGVAKAIRQAGIRLISSIDSSGLMSPHIHTGDYIRLNMAKQLAGHGWLSGLVRGMALIAKNSVPSHYDIPRLGHLDHADVVAMVTPRAVDSMKELAHRFGHPEVAARTHLLPHPQLASFEYDGTPKERLILSVGRWEPQDWFQKNPTLLVSSIDRFLTARTDYQHLIVGNGVQSLKPLVSKLEKSVKSRIQLISFLSPTELKKLYCRAQIGFWTSRHEGQQNSGAQALCCGASVVGTSGMAVNCFAYYASQNSGHVPTRNTPENLADALQREAQAWDKGERDPYRIASTWSSKFHAARVAQRAIDLILPGHSHSHG